MIAQLSGNLILRSPDKLIVDVNGVGYLVHSPLSTFYSLPELGGQVALKIHTHMSEQALKLFGFLTQEELTLFETLIGVNKVGPKLALAILSGMSPADLTVAIQNNDIARLNKIPGVGRKTAERLIIEIRDKLPKLEATPQSHVEHWEGNAIMDDALSALVNLGYKKNEAERALKLLSGKDKETPALEVLIKESLNLLS
ncbi:MAG: Holliday junction branch migration protein RuvA [Nitrospinae bacterium CG11_big_fil_rev_8_21_14_0_20_45_15]|nr:MAG: Holliday junction branch migration protein RuvA [Nitrospinae bacterium CG11_big_fil_rev_8_21_14_0_20_45_15]